MCEKLNAFPAKRGLECAFLEMKKYMGAGLPKGKAKS